MLTVCSCALLEPASLPDPGDARGVEFAVWLPGAACVQLVGDWNDWGGLAASEGVLDPSAGPMQEEDGWWTAAVELPRGRYRYAFVADGAEWSADALNHIRSVFMGHDVSVVVVDR